MISNEKGLIKTNKNFFSKIFDKIKIFFFKKYFNKTDTNISKQQTNNENTYNILINEYNDLQNKLNVAKQELKFLKIKKLKITLAIYQKEEEFLKEIFRMKKETLEIFLKEF